MIVGKKWEGVGGRNGEDQGAALIEAYNGPYGFYEPLTRSVTLDKAVAKRLVREAGLPTAPFAVIESDADARACPLPYPLFVKPLAEGTGKGCERASKVTDRKALVAAARDRKSTRLNSRH